MDTPKVRVGQTLVIHGDDWHLRIFAAHARPNDLAPTYWVLYEDAYGDLAYDIVTAEELDRRIRDIAADAGDESPEAGAAAPQSLDDLLRKANEYLHKQYPPKLCPLDLVLELKDFS